MDSVSKVLGKILKKLANVKKEDKVLVVGLGNWNVTPDALGPKVIEGIMVTRHLSQVMPEFMEEDMISVAAISPGVLGTTGIETVEVIKALVENIKPSLIICIDALAARRIERLNKTIQISDTGISPGAGVGNHRKAINKEELGVRVIAVGVPTVVDASTIANDTIDMVLDNLINEAEEGKEFYNMLKNVDKDAKKVLISGMVIVSPHFPHCFCFHYTETQLLSEKRICVFVRPFASSSIDLPYAASLPAFFIVPRSGYEASAFSVLSSGAFVHTLPATLSSAGSAGAACPCGCTGHA